MKFYSEELKKFFDTEEQCLAEEEKARVEAEEKKVTKAKLAKAIEDADKDLDEAYARLEEAKKKVAELRKEEEKRLRKEAAKAKKKKKSMSEILDVVHMARAIAAEVIRRFFRHLRIDLARVHIKVATGDAATTAVAYGAACTAINMLLPVLSEVENFSMPREQDFSVEADFLGESPTLDLKISFSLRVWHVLHIAFGALGQFLRHKAKSQPQAPNENHKYK